MNIIFISSNITNSGGTERIGIGLANELAKQQNTTVTIISLFGSGNPFFEINPKIKVHTLFSKHISLIFVFPIAIWKIRKILNKQKHKSIILNIGALLSVFSIVANWGIKHCNIIWEHFNVSLIFKSKKEQFARYMACQYAEAIVTLTVKDRDMYLEQFKCKAKVVCIPNFLTIDPIFESSAQEVKMAVALGRLTEQKGFDRLLQIWSKLDSSFDDWQLNIIGDGEDRQKLEEIVLNNKLKNVHLISTTKDVAYYYNRASLYLMTSRWEGLPMVLIEAQSFGLPIISYDCLTGPRDVIKNTLNGFLISDGNEHAFINTLERCMGDYQLRTSMSKQSLIDSRRFDRNQIIKVWLDLFSEFKVI